MKEKYIKDMRQKKEKHEKEMRRIKEKYTYTRRRNYTDKGKVHIYMEAMRQRRKSIQRRDETEKCEQEI